MIDLLLLIKEALMPGKALSLLALPFLLPVLVLGVCCQAANCKVVAPVKSVYKAKSHNQRILTSAALLSLLRGNPYASLVGGDDVSVAGGTVRLAVWAHCTAGINDLKADAVMLAQAVGRHFPDQFDKLECSFFDCSFASGGSLPFASVSVKESDLIAFARGRMSHEKLLQTVSLTAERESSVAEKYRALTYRQILDQNLVVPGAYGTERKELCDQLTTLKANGYDVNQATRQFFALEDLVRTKQYDRLSGAFAQTRKCIAESVAGAQGVSVATSRTLNWQR